MDGDNEADAYKENDEDNDKPAKAQKEVEEPVKKNSVIGRTLEEDEEPEQKPEVVEDPLDLEGLDWREEYIYSFINLELSI